MAEQECKEAADAAQEIKLKWDVKLDELLRMAERIYKYVSLPFLLVFAY